MAKFRKKPVTIEAHTFDEMLEFGAKQPDAGFSDDVLWSFSFNGRPVTHQTDDSYLISTLEGDHLMTRDAMLIIGVKGEMYPCRTDIFEETYEEVSDD